MLADSAALVDVFEDFFAATVAFSVRRGIRVEVRVAASENSLLMAGSTERVLIEVRVAELSALFSAVRPTEGARLESFVALAVALVLETRPVATVRLAARLE